MPIDLTQSKLSPEDVLRQYMEKVVNKQREQANSKLVNLRSTRPVSTTPSTALRSEPAKQGYFEPIPSKVRVRDWLREMGSLGKKGIDFLISSERDFGQTLGDALATMSSDVKEAQKAQESLDNMNMKLGKTIVAAKKQGKDTSQLEDFYKRNTGQIFNIEDIIPSTKKTAKQIYGEGLGVAADIAAFGRYGRTAKGAKSFRLLGGDQIKANVAAIKQAKQMLRPDAVTRKLKDAAQKVHETQAGFKIGSASIQTKGTEAAKAVSNINPNNIASPKDFVKVVKKTLEKYGLDKNKELIKEIFNTADDFNLYIRFGGTPYLKKETAKQAFAKGFKEAIKIGAPLGAAFNLSSALRKNKNTKDSLKQTAKGYVMGALLTGIVGGTIETKDVKRLKGLTTQDVRQGIKIINQLLEQIEIKSGQLFRP